MTAVIGQSGRTVTVDADSSAPNSNKTIKQMFDEANSYNKVKFAEFEAKKLPFSEELRIRTEREQQALAAKYAAEAGLRESFAGDDLYYLGMLHWIAGNLDGTADGLTRYVSSETPNNERKQTARSIIVVTAAQQKRFTEGEKVLTEYLESTPVKLAERARMTSEMAKAYLADAKFSDAERHAAGAYSVSKDILKDPALRTRGLDELLDAGMLLFETRRAKNDINSADAALEDMRSVAASVKSPSFYYYAADKQIVYQIETGRKKAALENYAALLKRADKDFTVPGQQADVVRRLKRREKHYQILGEPAVELTSIDQWFPGERLSMEQLRGKVVMLDFWATWCAPCYEAFPSLVEWQSEFADDGFVILGITRYYGMSDGTKADKPAELASLKRFKEKYKLNYDFVVATDQTPQRNYGATSLPTAVLIDRKGIVRYAESGTNSTRLEEMREMIIKLLAEK